MSEHPILFSGEMVRAILKGGKTQTRRVIKPEWSRCLDLEDDEDRTRARLQCPYGWPGNKLWVRESWLPDAPIDGWDGCYEWNGCGRPIDGVPEQYKKPEYCLYAATWTGTNLSWRPSIHMPRWASRITLEIVSVRVERVRDISKADAYAEGIKPDEYYYGFPIGNPVISFADLWDSINEKRGYGWVVNPWVWVIEFKRIV